MWVGLFLGVLTINRLSIVTNRWWASVGFIGYGLLYFNRGNIAFAGRARVSDVSSGRCSTAMT